MRGRLIPLLLAAALLATACAEVDTDALIGADSGPIATPPGETTPDANATTTPNTTGEIAGAPSGRTSTRASPVPAGQIADVGSGWKLQVIGVEPDATATVLEENSFNDPPPTGSVFTIVRVAVGYYGVDDPAAWFNLNVSAVGDSLELDDGCGVIPDDFPFGEVYAGGTLERNVCFVSSGEISDLMLYAEEFFSFDGETAFLEIGEPTTIEPMPSLRGPQPRAAATPGRLYPIDAATPTAVGTEWTITVGSGRLGTEEIRTAAEFNDPPPAGFDFYLVDLNATYNGTGTGSIFDLDIDGVTDSNITLDGYCGFYDNTFDISQDVFPGGTLQGTVCFVVPSGDTASLVLSVRESFEFDADAFYFAPA
jgi:hypothetical protein